MQENYNYLLSDFDGLHWAKAFCEVVGEKIPEIKEQESWMHTWFANAIMCGYDCAKREMDKNENAG